MMEEKNWINKLDDLDGEKPAAPKPKKTNSPDFGNLDPNTIIYGLAAGVALILILIVVLFFRTGKDPATAEFQQMNSRLDTLEAQINKIEGREEERQKAFVQFTQTEHDVRAGLESHREAIDDIRQKLAELEETAQKPAPAPPRREEPRPEPKPEPEAPRDTVTHEVQRGENLFRIGLKYNISVDELMRLNSLSPGDSIHPGQKLVVGTKND
jgi:LysM repeat protein